MGIDIYCRWKGQDEGEEKAQYAGFDTTKGDVGYLREAYHGGPYVTHYLLDEAFEKGEAKIPASVLLERLPTAVLIAMYREKKIYGKKDPTNVDIKELPNILKNIFEIEVKDGFHKEFIKSLTPHHLEYAEKMIVDRSLPKYAQSFVDFVELCEKKEKLTGEPCNIVASY